MEVNTPRKNSCWAKYAHRSLLKKNHPQTTNKQKTPQNPNGPIFILFLQLYFLRPDLHWIPARRCIKQSDTTQEGKRRLHRNSAVSCSSRSRKPYVTPCRQLQQALQGRGNKHTRYFLGPRTWSLALLSTSVIPLLCLSYIPFLAAFG